ncbi:MAG: glycosyltransferase family 2 protein [Parasphingopyxis sp.]|nr:glycosyltransferase family 2 protein [Sphingomonadales bacterium]
MIWRRKSAEPEFKLSVIVVAYNMRREVPRTLFSLTTEFQRCIDPGDYEVIVVENGSSDALSAEEVEAFGPNFRYHYIADASPSPANAINVGAAMARGRHLGIMIDGARIVSPGMLGQALGLLEQFDRAFVGTISFHLGPKSQTESVTEGYTQQVEDGLLEGIGWRTNGYRLFEISALASTCQSAGAGPIGESNMVFLSKDLFDEMAGFDERFDIPGGGMVNLDFYKRGCDLPGSQLFTIFGEGTFHQMHGGVMSNRPQAEGPSEVEKYRRQYREIRGEDFAISGRTPLMISYPIREFRPGILHASRTLAARTPKR